MMGEEETGLGDAVFFVAPAVLAAIFTAVPLENMLSEFPFQHVFPWYPPWRGALVSFLLWIVAGLILSEKRPWSKLFFAGSAASFIVYHYLMLFETVATGHPVAVYPLFYTVGRSPPIIDLAQIVAILTVLALKKDVSELAKKWGLWKTT